MYIWLTHTTAIRDLRAADNAGSSSLKASKGCEACPAQNGPATLEEVGCAYVHPGVWLIPRSLGPSSPYRNILKLVIPLEVESSIV